MIAFFASLVYFGAKTFAVESADCEIVFRLRGPELTTLQAMEVRLVEKDEERALLGEFRKYYESGSTTPLGRWPLVISEGDYLVECDLHTAKGVVSLTLPVSLVDGDAVSVYIDPTRAND